MTLKFILQESPGPGVCVSVAVCLCVCACVFGCIACCYCGCIRVIAKVRFIGGPNIRKICAEMKM